MGILSQQVHLVRRPKALPEPSDFCVVDVELPDLDNGQLLVENLYMSVDPYMRRSMEAEAIDLEPWPIGGPLDGPSIGRVIESRNARIPVGALVESMSGWQRHFVSDGTPFIPYLTPNNAVAIRQAEGAAPQDFVGILGIAAMTAYAAMSVLAAGRSPGTVVVSSGAGTVGSVACQIARNAGWRVVASAGSADKVDWLIQELGVAHGFNYRGADLGAALTVACPDGIDLVLENASPEHLSACLPLMNDLGLILIAGFVSLYNSGGVASPVGNFHFVLDRYVTIQAFRFMDSLHAYDRFVSDMLRWRAEGRMTFRETVHQGLAAAPEALCALFKPQSLAGKHIVQIGTEQ